MWYINLGRWIQLFPFNVWAHFIRLTSVKTCYAPKTAKVAISIAAALHIDRELQKPVVLNLTLAVCQRWTQLFGRHQSSSNQTLNTLAEDSAPSEHNGIEEDCTLFPGDLPTLGLSVDDVPITQGRLKYRGRGNSVSKFLWQDDFKFVYHF